MCAGNAGRQAHHAREQAKRDAAAAMAQQERAYNEMLSMIPKAPEYTPPPSSSRSNLDDTGSGVRTAKAKRKSAMNMNKGVAALRIPLNTGGGSGGGLNVG